MKNLVFTITCSGICFFLLLFMPTTCLAAENQAAQADSAHEKAANTVIVRVDQGQVTLGQVMKKIKELTIKKYGFSEITPTLAEKIKEDAVEMLTSEELAYQQARKIGIKVSPAEIQQYIESYKKSLGGDDKFRDYLLANNMTLDDLNIQGERFLAVKKALAQEVDTKIPEVTEADIVKAYNQAKEQYFVQQERVVASTITFFLDPDEKESLQKVTAVRNQLTGELAGDVAKLPADPSFIVRENLTLNESVDQSLHKVAIKLQPNEISTPTISKGTYHLVKLLSYTPRVEKTIDEVRPYLKKKVLEKFKQDRLDEWRENIRKNTEIERFEIKMD